MHRLWRALVALFLLTFSAHASESTRAPLRHPQIEWQRTLSDALALCADEQRPLLVAINVDGEAASDRIVLENYRDPGFVASTRSLVCVVASVSRHNARDHDERGRRIPCPRLGRVTCGEHIALEPLLFDAYLGGTRVSPRHALVQRDGSKTFDLYLLFDLREIDRALARAAATAPKPRDLERDTERADDRRALVESALARSNAGRDRFEETLLSLRDDDALVTALDAIGDAWARRRAADETPTDVKPTDAAVQDAAQDVEPLRALLRREIPLSPAASDALERCIARAGLDAAWADALRDELRSLGPLPTAFGLGDDRRLIPLVARAAGSDPALRSQLFAWCAFGDERDRAIARAACGAVLDVEGLAALDAAIEREGGPVDLARLLWFARDVGRRAPPASTRTNALPPRDELEAELMQADELLAADAEDPDALERFGMASLNVARARMESGAEGIAYLLEDASRTFAAADAARERSSSTPDVEARLKRAIERARVAYYMSRFDRQEAASSIALSEWSLMQAGVQDDVRRAQALADDETRVEALRWLGDAAARSVATRAGGDVALEVGGIVRGARAFALVCASPFADEVDWQSLASFLDVLGASRGSASVLRHALERFPHSRSLRSTFYTVLREAGRIELAPRSAEDVLARTPTDAQNAWWAGYAWLLDGEDARRTSEFTRAAAAYEKSLAHFERAHVLDPVAAASAQHYRALASLGRGFAALDTRSVERAAACLTDALRWSPDAAFARDGLDREALDLVDGVLEWRAGQAPVDALEFARALAEAAPGPQWPSAVADSGLREALRADSRSPRMVDVPAILQRPEDDRPDGLVRAEVREPSAEGDRFLAASIAAARMALAAEDSEATRRTLAQSLSVHAERRLLRERLDEAHALASEAARLVGVPEPTDASFEALAQCVNALRARLGAARPVLRPGR